MEPGLISSTSFDEKLGFPAANHKINDELIIITDFDWKHLCRTKTSQKALSKTFYYKNKGSKKVKKPLF